MTTPSPLAARTAWALALPLRGPRKAAMLALAMRADDAGRCWPSLETLAADAGLGRTALLAALAELEAAGLLTRTAQGGRDPVTGAVYRGATVYRLAVGATLESPRGDTSPERPAGGPNGAAPERSPREPNPERTATRTFPDRSASRPGKVRQTTGELTRGTIASQEGEILKVGLSPREAGHPERPAGGPNPPPAASGRAFSTFDPDDAAEVVDDDPAPPPSGRPCVLAAIAPADLDALRARYAETGGDGMTDAELDVIEADCDAAVREDREATHPAPADWPDRRAALAAAGRRLMRPAPQGERAA